MHERLRNAFLLIAVTLLASACAYQAKEVPEIMPGILQGYLSQEEQLDSRAFVPPPPPVGSPLAVLDAAWAERMITLRGTARWTVATEDAVLHFPEAASTFACALGVPVSEAQTPELYLLLRRTLTDLGLATYPAKNAYQRPRPFMDNGAPTCTPQDEDKLRHDGSYPSGHTAIGWGWALILTELSPDQSAAILARGRSFGESRNVCNVHWYSDVVAGRLVGAGAVARLHDDEEFRAAMRRAKVEIERARAAGLAPSADCAAENRALEEL